MGKLTDHAYNPGQKSWDTLAIARAKSRILFTMQSSPLPLPLTMLISTPFIGVFRCQHCFGGEGGTLNTFKTYNNTKVFRNI